MDILGQITAFNTRSSKDTAEQSSMLAARNAAKQEQLDLHMSDLQAEIDCETNPFLKAELVKSLAQAAEWMSEFGYVLPANCE